MQSRPQVDVAEDSNFIHPYWGYLGSLTSFLLFCFGICALAQVSLFSFIGLVGGIGLLTCSMVSMLLSGHILFENYKRINSPVSTPVTPITPITPISIRVMPGRFRVPFSSHHSSPNRLPETPSNTPERINKTRRVTFFQPNGDLMVLKRVKRVKNNKVIMREEKEAKDNAQDELNTAFILK